MDFVPALFAFTDGDVWRPGIGDPTVMGWLTVIAYFVTAVMAFRCARLSSQERDVRTNKLFWSGLTVLLVLLGINKQLDLQTALTLTGRRIALAQGWYDHRRGVQLVFIIVIAMAAVAGFLVMWNLVRRTGKDLWIPLLGFVLLLTFVIVRAASFHHVDLFIHANVAGVRMNWVLELGSIAVIALGAFRKLRGASAHDRMLVQTPAQL